jgi:hypothetical protein
VSRTIDGTKILTLQAGLPGSLWPYAMCHAQDTDVVDGDSAWDKRHDQGQWDGPTIPFGCLSDFKPQKDVAKKMLKGTPDTVPGVCFWGTNSNQGAFGRASIECQCSLNLRIWI